MIPSKDVVRTYNEAVSRALFGRKRAWRESAAGRVRQLRARHPNIAQAWVESLDLTGEKNRVKQSTRGIPRR